MTDYATVGAARVRYCHCHDEPAAFEPTNVVEDRNPARFSAGAGTFARAAIGSLRGRFAQQPMLIGKTPGGMHVDLIGRRGTSPDLIGGIGWTQGEFDGIAVGARGELIMNPLNAQTVTRFGFASNTTAESARLKAPTAFQPINPSTHVAATYGAGTPVRIQSVRGAMAYITIDDSAGQAVYAAWTPMASLDRGIFRRALSKVTGRFGANTAGAAADASPLDSVKTSLGKVDDSLRPFGTLAGFVAGVLGTWMVLDAVQASKDSAKFGAAGAPAGDRSRRGRRRRWF